MARPETRAAGITALQAAPYGAITLALSIAAARGLLPSVMAGSLTNPDSYMRLARLAEMIRGGVLVDAVSNDGSGQGTVLHWSHLLDGIIYLLALALHRAAADPGALFWAGVALGPLSMGALGMALAWSIAPMAPRPWLWTGPVLLALSTPVLNYGLPGVVHHHVLLGVIALLTAGCAARAIMARDGVRPAAGLGAWAAIGIWLSPESMPFTMMAFGGLWLAWLLRPAGNGASAGAVLAAGSSFLAAAGAAFLLDPPLGAPWQAFVDRLSVTYLVLAAATCLIGAAAIAIDHRRLPPVQRAWLGAAIGALLLGGWVWRFPDILRGSDSVLDPAQAQAMLGVISEMQPVRELAEGIEYLMNAVLAAGLLTVLAIVRRSPLLGYAAVCGIVCVGLGTAHIRFATYPTIFGAAVLPSALGWLQSRLDGRAEWRQASIRIAVFMTVFAATRAQAIELALIPAKAVGNAAECSIRTLSPVLQMYAGQVVLSEAGETPELLYRTGVLTVGSLYHRNAAGFFRLQAAWASPPSATVPDAVRATGASLVLVCTKAGLPAGDDGEPRNLLGQLRRGVTPPWLEPVLDDPMSGHRLYRVRP